MMETIKSSILGKCLQALLIGYFLMSSINISTSINGFLSSENELHSSALMANILKMIFECDGCPEEIEDYEAKAKSNTGCKGQIALDYLIPTQDFHAAAYNCVHFQRKGCTCNVALQCRYNSKIHLPPPEGFI